MKGCGELTNVEGTNGGKMRCGAKLTQLGGSIDQYFCGKCKEGAEMKHTPGPWETSVNGEEEFDICLPEGGDMIADLRGCDNQEANAHLIAAAPELLAALAMMVSAANVKEIDPLIMFASIEKAKDTINKAEGTKS